MATIGRLEVIGAAVLFATACGSVSNDARDAGATNITIVSSGDGAGVVTSSPAGIDCGTSCTASFAPGTVVNLTIVADSNSSFAGWADDCSGTATTCSVTVDAAKIVGVTLDRKPVDLVVTLAGAGNGTVTSAPAGIDCGADCTETFGFNTMISLTATANSTSVFGGWSGGGCSGTADCMVTMNAAKAITATFDKRCLANPTTVITPGMTTVTVPDDCNAAIVKVWGAAGGGSIFSSGGGGGFAIANIRSTPAEHLTIHIGAGGVGTGMSDGGGGGGASAVLRTATPLVVGGGGGGGGTSGNGGPGGGTIGVDGLPPGGGGTIAMVGEGGAQAAGGTGGVGTLGGDSGTDGVNRHGGDGGRNAAGSGGGGAGGVGYGSGGAGGLVGGGGGGPGGAGGGGFFGGGGGGGAMSITTGGAGGGGGSSYINHPDNTMTMTTAGNGLNPGGTTDPDYMAGTALGALDATGGHGRVVIIWLRK